MLVAGPVAWSRFQANGVGSWFRDIDIDTSLHFLLLVVAPPLWFVKFPRGLTRRRPSRWLAFLSASIGAASHRPKLLVGALAGLVGLLALAASMFVAGMRVAGPVPAKIKDLPPAIHDEYSYLFQAQTFLAGRLWLPSHPATPDLFDQMHVLNEGRFASRYFPGTGAWIAPFLAIGHPRWGHWAAGSLTAMLVFAVGHELGGIFVGFVAGALTAVSPGMALFSNLFLAHHPTILGLMLFVWAFLRLIRTRRWNDAAVAGIGLTFAMLCRPMTAAGMALPFGVWFAWSLWRGRMARAENGGRATLALGLGAPVVIGLVAMCFYNCAITGDWRKTPYQLYTDIYTPRHVYGFNNVVRGKRFLGPKVLNGYDGWAKNLTPALAAQNVAHRLIASWRWTLGIVPLAMALPLFLFHAYGTDRRWWLPAAAIVSLHAAHAPYWWDGILRWHYVFESGPLWLLIFAGATGFLVPRWRAARRPLLAWWWAALIVAELVVSYGSLRSVWSHSKLEFGIAALHRNTQGVKAFRDAVELQVAHRPALVLVPRDQAHLSLAYVVNGPELDAAVLYGWLPQTDAGLAKVLAVFAGRTCYELRPGRIVPVGNGPRTVLDADGSPQ